MHGAIARAALRSAVLAGIALVFAGCGGGSTTIAKSSKGLNFQARVDQICTAKHTVPRVPASELSGLPSFDEIATRRARTARELSALQPPSALKSGYRRLVSLISHEAALLRRVAGYLRERNLASASATLRERRYSNPVPKQARLVGLAECA